MITTELLHKLLDESLDPVKFSSLQEPSGINGFELTYSSWMTFTNACRALGDAGWSGAPVIFEAKTLALSYYKNEQKMLNERFTTITHKIIMGYREPKLAGV